jgi:hypothetical protein
MAHRDCLERKTVGHRKAMDSRLDGRQRHAERRQVRRAGATPNAGPFCCACSMDGAWIVVSPICKPADLHRPTPGPG